jgi:hypothetical protein
MSKDNVTPFTARSQAATTREPKFPKTVEEKIIVAKTITQAVIAADHSGELEDLNYDRFWALRMVTELLDQAADQIDVEGPAGAAT